MHAEKICDQVVEIDENVRFAAIIDEQCIVIESSKSTQSHCAIAHKILSDRFHILLAQEYVR
ncbi:MAG TPA: hypothetical protein VFM64_04830, partial [Candidatus Nitrosotenuis sp.]|nr:hypothetical protein [Candidatus Nitrosotenuis sp.]